MGILISDISRLHDIFTVQPVNCGIVINVFQDISSHSIRFVLNGNESKWSQMNGNVDSILFRGIFLDSTDTWRYGNYRLYKTHLVSENFLYHFQKISDTCDRICHSRVLKHTMLIFDNNKDQDSSWFWDWFWNLKITINTSLVRDTKITRKYTQMFVGTVNGKMKW